MLKTRKTLGIIALCVSGVMIGGCGSEPGPFNPSAIEQIQKEAARDAAPPDMRPLPTTLPAMGVGTSVQPSRAVTRPMGPTVRMKLQEIIHRTVVNNLDARVAGYQTAIDEVRILEAEANFDPTLFAGLTAARQYPQGVQPSNFHANRLDSQQLNGGVRQKLENGATIELNAQSTRSQFPFSPFTFNPLVQTKTVYDDQLNLKITQPLLQNSGTEVNRARITIARNDFKISRLDWRDQVEKVIQQVEENYWKLLVAQQDVEILERLLQETERTLNIIMLRGGLDVSSLQISQVRASYEQRAAALVRARSRIDDLSDQIKRLMNDPEHPVSETVTILPDDMPVEEPVIFILSDQIEAGLYHRLELEQQKLRIDSALTVIKASRNNMLPQLNLVASMGLEGLGNDFKAALNEAEETRLFNYSVGFQFEVPIGNRLARAIYQRTLLQHQQAIDQYRLLANQVAQEVKTAQRDVQTSWSEIEAARKARFAAADALGAIKAREEAGQAKSPEFIQLVLDRQSSLAETKRAENQAMANYNVAMSALEKAKGTLLRYNNVVLMEEKGPWKLPKAEMAAKKK